MYFNLLAPRDEVLTNKRDSPDMLFLIIGALCLLLSSPFWFFGIRGRRRAR